MRLYTSSFILAFILLTSITYGQTKNKKNETDTTKHWEVGLDLLWLIDKNQVPSTSLFGRYNFVDKGNSYKAWRFRIGMDNNYYDSSRINGMMPHDIKVNSILLRPGFEWQKRPNLKYTFFYGGDLNLFYRQEKFKNIIATVPEPLQYDGTFKTWELGLVGFIGFKYSPIKWLSISTESTLNIMYRIRRDKSQTGPPAFPGASGESGLSVDDFHINVFPISVINLCFKI